MRRTFGTVSLGFAFGILLSASRAMAGTDLLTWVGPNASTVATCRAWPLALLAVLFVARDEAGSWLLWLATAAGFAAHGLLTGPAAGFPWLATAAAIVGAFLYLRSRSRPSGDLQAKAIEEDGAHPFNALETIGSMIAGGGAAVALEAIARHVRLFGAGLTQDDTVFGATFLAFAAFGAAAFGWIFTLRPLRRLSFPVLLAGTATACYVSILQIDAIATGFPLGEFVKRWNLRATDFGGVAWDALIAARILVLPAMVLGTALASARGRSALASALFGAAVGMWALPRILDRGAEKSLDDAELFASQLVPMGTLVAIAGAGLAALAESRRRAIARYAALVAIGVLGIVPIRRTTKPLVVLSPWEGRAIMPYLTYESPVGLITVEPSRFLTKVATVDRRRVTPDRDELEADVQRLHDSVALVPAAIREKRALRVLFVGQLTPVRSESLKSEGVVRIDRTSPWARTMSRVENELFRAPDGQTSMTMPAGDVIESSEARTRIDRGDYDLVIAPPVQGDAPAVSSAGVPSTTTVVRWVDLSVPLRGVRNHSGQGAGTPGHPAEDQVVWSANGLSMPTLGFVDNASIAPNGPRFVNFRVDLKAPRPVRWLETAWASRADAARARTTAALVEAADDASRPMTKALAAFYAEQVVSSPFESPSQGVELSTATLATLAEATRGPSLDANLRSTWEWIAGVLVEKRDVASIERWLAPLARDHAPWSALEIALAHAEMEGLDAKAAAERLKPIVQREPGNVAAWFTLGEALELSGDSAGTAAAFRSASDLAPHDRMLRRRLALALTRAGDPEGPRIAGQLLVADDKDVEMKACFDGKPPPAPTTYQPSGTH